MNASATICPSIRAAACRFQYYFPLDAEYVIRIKIGRRRTAGSGVVRWKCACPSRPACAPSASTFLRESAKPEVAAPGGGRRGGAAGAAARAPARGRMPPAEMDLRLDGVKLKRFEVPAGRRSAAGRPASASRGPYNVTGRGDTPSRERIFVCRPAAAKDEEPCARTILATLGRRAFRRPVTDADLKPLLAFYQSGRAEGDFDHRHRKGAARHAGLARFPVPRRARSARRARPAPSTASAISNWRRASRSSCGAAFPTTSLLDLAEQGKLKDPAVLEQQVRRMLDDPRSQVAGRQLRRPVALPAQPRPRRSPTPTPSPSSTRACARPSSSETELFFQSILREDRSVLDLLDANYTFLNERLAEHYGIPNVYGPQFRRVDADRSEPRRPAGAGQHPHGDVVSQPHLGGAARQVDSGEPAGHAAAAAAARRSGAEAARQGRQAAHDARADGAAPRQSDLRLLPRAHGSARLRARELRRRRRVARPRMPARRSMPRASCPTARSSTGPAGLKKLLLANYRDEFVATVTEKLLTYALGRGLEYYDQPAVRAIARAGRQRRLPHVGPDCRHRQKYAISDEEDSGTMIITKKSLPRRTFLRGLGTTLALPLLDAMVPALGARPGAAKPVGPPGIRLRSRTA